jgi:GNAT superfamily N-acetyltransferase
MLLFHFAETADVVRLGDLARKAWFSAYSSIVSNEQIEYMLFEMYNPDLITKQILEGEIRWLVGTEDLTWIGFASFGPHPKNQGVYRLHKLYLDPDFKGQGLGKSLLEDVIKQVPKEIKQLELNVNKQNPALAFYKKMGFTILREEVLDIGKGFVMDDYVMVLDIN